MSLHRLLLQSLISTATDHQHISEQAPPHLPITASSPTHLLLHLLSTGKRPRPSSHPPEPFSSTSIFTAGHTIEIHPSILVIFFIHCSMREQSLFSARSPSSSPQFLGSQPFSATSSSKSFSLLQFLCSSSSESCPLPPPADSDRRQAHPPCNKPAPPELPSQQPGHQFSDRTPSSLSSLSSTVPPPQPSSTAPAALPPASHFLHCRLPYRFRPQHLSLLCSAIAEDPIKATLGTMSKTGREIG